MHRETPGSSCASIRGRPLARSYSKLSASGARPSLMSNRLSCGVNAREPPVWRSKLLGGRVRAVEPVALGAGRPARRRAVRSSRSAGRLRGALNFANASASCAPSEAGQLAVGGGVLPSAQGGATGTSSSQGGRGRDRWPEGSQLVDRRERPHAGVHEAQEAYASSEVEPAGRSARLKTNA